MDKGFTVRQKEEIAKIASGMAADMMVAHLVAYEHRTDPDANPEPESPVEDEDEAVDEAADSDDVLDGAELEKDTVIG